MKTERGVVVVTALLVVLLAAGVSAYLLAQQGQALSRTLRAAERAQAAQYAKPTLDWARAALFEMQRKTPRVDLTQPWARGLAAVPVDGALAGGALTDAAGRFNLNNLVKAGVRSEADAKVFRALLARLGLDPDLCDAVVDWIDADDDPAGPGGVETPAYIAAPVPTRAANQPMAQVDELRRVRGVTPAVFTRLAPFVSALPERTALNVNTAPEEVLAALFREASAEEIAALVKRRLQKPFDDRDAIKAVLKGVPPAVIDDQADVTSRYFLAEVAIDSNGTRVRQSALLRRAPGEGPGGSAPPAKWPSIIWARFD